jgi:hypothetical protein
MHTLRYPVAAHPESDQYPPFRLDMGEQDAGPRYVSTELES